MAVCENHVFKLHHKIAMSLSTRDIALVAGGAAAGAVLWSIFGTKDGGKQVS